MQAHDNDEELIPNLPIIYQSIQLLLRTNKKCKKTQKKSPKWKRL